MTKTITLTIGEAEIAMQAIAKYSELMEANQETKWLSEGTVEIVKSIISQLEQTEEEAQTFGKLEAFISSHLTPDELTNYSLSDVSITLINNNTGEKSAVEVESFDLTEIQWIVEDKNEEYEYEKITEIREIPQTILGLAKDVFGDTNYKITGWDLDRTYIDKEDENYTVRMWNITDESIRWTLFKTIWDENGLGGGHGEIVKEGIFDVFEYEYGLEIEGRRNQTSDFSLIEVEDEMNQSKYVALVLNFLKDEILECVEASEDHISIELRDCNFEINGVRWEKALQEHLSNYDYSVHFTGGDGHWATIYNKTKMEATNMTNTNAEFQAKSKWENDLEQRGEGEVEMIFNMADDIRQVLEGSYFTYDEFGYEVPATNQIQAYEAVLEAAQGYLMNTARRIEYYQSLEEKLMLALNDSQALINKQNQLLNENKLEISNIKSSMKRYEEELDCIMDPQINKAKPTLLN